MMVTQSRAGSAVGPVCERTIFFNACNIIVGFQGGASRNKRLQADCRQEYHGRDRQKVQCTPFLSSKKDVQNKKTGE